MEVHAHTNTALDPDPSTNSGHRGRKNGPTISGSFSCYFLLFSVDFWQSTSWSIKLRKKEAGNIYYLSMKI